MKQERIMLDLETLGKRPGSVIVAIGAVKFGAGGITSTFYGRVDPESCVSAGMRMDVSTVMWWLQQADEARMEITKPGRSLSEVLVAFSQWIGCDDAEVWGNGAAFDNALLAEAYHCVQLRCPWKFWNDRCYRTLKNEHPEVPMVRGGIHHHALADAESQARHLIEIFRLRNKAA